MANLLNKIFFPKDHKPDHFKALDGIRGIAVLLVMFSHSSNIFVWFHDKMNFTETGKLGVYLFFLLSAYLLDRQIAIALKNGQATWRYWANYLMRRFLRIYPLFFIALLFNYWLVRSGSEYPIQIVDWNDIGQHLLLQRGKRVFWSIPVEFIYYFISPLILLVIGRITKWNPMLFLLGIFLMIAAVVFFTSPLELKPTNTVKYLPIFLIGTLISLAEVMSNAFDKLNKDEKWRWDILAFSAMLVLVLTFRSIYRNYYDALYPFHDEQYYLLYSVLWGILLIVAKNTTGLTNRILSFKPLRFVGVVSFSAYLFHIPVLNFVAYSDYFPHKLRMVIFVILTLLFSTVTYLLVERPLSRIRLKI